MKKCPNCNNEVIDSTNKIGGSAKIYCSKKCTRKAHKKRGLLSKKLKFGTYVYYLPEEHYIGITANISARMSGHRSAGKSTEGYEVLCSFKRKVDAAWLEIMFHQRGYLGFNYANRKK